MKLIILLIAAILGLASSLIIPGQKVHFISLPHHHNQNNSTNNTSSSSEIPTSSTSSPSPSNGFDGFIARSHFLPNTTLCPMGFVKTTTEDGFDCSRPFCHLESDCTVLFGENTTCNFQTAACVCDVDHSVDDQQRCTIFTGTSTPTPETPPFSILNSSCYDNGQCSVLYGAECRDNVCACSFGFVPEQQVNGNSNYSTCVQPTCFRSDYCQALFNDPNTACNTYENICGCADHFSYDAELRSCQPTTTPLGAECFADDDCDSATAACVNYRCGCQLGYAANHSYSAYACQQVACSDDWDCQVQVANGTSCNLEGACECSYGAGYQLDGQSQQCRLRAKPLGAGCFTDSDCGLAANCVHEKCRCESGWAAKTNNMDCSLVSCQVDSDCQVLDPNSMCSIFSSDCQCKDGFIIDYGLQKCTKDDTADNDNNNNNNDNNNNNNDDDDDDDDDQDYSFLTSVTIFSVFSILFIFLTISIVAARNRRALVRQQQLQLQQRQRRQRAAAALANRNANLSAYLSTTTTTTEKVALPITKS